MNKKKYPIPATIVIRLNGDETIATIMGDEFCTRFTRTLAKRNPKDEYDAYIGARVALDRLFDKAIFEEHPEDAAPEKNKEEPRPRWKTGDKVIAVNAPILKAFFGQVGTVTGVKYNASLKDFEYEAEFGPKRIKQWWNEFGGEKVRPVRAATAEDLVEKASQNASEPEKTQPRWKIGDRVIATGHPIRPEHYGKEGTVTKVGPAFTPGATRYHADFGGVTQTWCSWNTDAVKKAPEKTQAHKKYAGPAPKFQVGDIVRVTDAVLPCGFYATGDVAVVTRVDKKSYYDGYCYVIKVRSKERKGREGYAWEEELTLLHRPAKEGEKR